VALSTSSSTTASTATTEPEAARLAASAAAPARAAAPGRATQVGRRILLFGIGDRLYGCEIDAVREIIPIRTATRLPGAPAHVRGLINLRGTLLTVIDLAGRLGLGETRADGSIVLVHGGGKVVGVSVDEVRDVQLMGTDRIELASGDQSRGGIVRGIGHLDDSTIVILLDMQSIVTQVLL
jgi:purine-binding chemotaxis protein CheW